MAIFGKKEKDENSPVVQPPPIQKEITEPQQKNTQKIAAKALAKAGADVAVCGRGVHVRCLRRRLQVGGGVG